MTDSALAQARVEIEQRGWWVTNDGTLHRVWERNEDGNAEVVASGANERQALSEALGRPVY